MKKKIGVWVIGIGIPLLIAISAKYLAALPFLKIMGQLVLAILLGMLWNTLLKIPQEADKGIQFTSKKILRLGIILLGMRLNLLDIINAGPKVFALSVIDIGFTLFVVYGLARWMGVEKKLGLLTASGTAICGAAAIAAIAPQVKADNKQVAVSATTIAILGTFFTLAYTFLYPILGLSTMDYGIFSGATLHEIAHVMAAAAPGGAQAIDEAIIVKLTRVALLVPVAIGIYYFFTRKEEQQKVNSGEKRPAIPIPWFILGFLAASGLNTLHIIPQGITDGIVTFSYLLIAMAMAALGLGVNFSVFRQIGYKPFVAGFTGSILLSLLGYILVHYLGMGV